MKFVISYSCGKDSTLALHRMIQSEHTPVALAVTVNRELARSWFHGADIALLNDISDALGIPLLPCETDGENYHLALEQTLREAKKLGAEACVFGDIDIEEHKKWSSERCEHAGLAPIFPLWQESRKSLTREVIELGYQAIFKCVKNGALPQSLLGKTLNADTVALMQTQDVDICGENGEYHTLVVGGPIFRRPVPIQYGEILDFGNISVIDLTLAPQNN